MATIEIRNGKPSVRWRDPDGTEHRRTCPSRAVAKALLLEVETAAAFRRRWEPAAAPRAPLLRDLIAAFLRDFARTARPRSAKRAHELLRPWLVWMQSVHGIDATTRTLTHAAVTDHDASLVGRESSARTRRMYGWAIGACWRWGWQHPDWRPHLAEPSMPRMPALEEREVVAASWAQMDAVVEAARAEADRLPSREWVRRAVVLLRALGWRVSQIVALDWGDVSLEAGTMRLRPELGKSVHERRGRTVPIPPWLVAELAGWGTREGPIVGHASASLRRTAATRVRECWAATDAPVTIYAQRPDHAFRIGLISGLTRARADREAAEHYVGHAPGIRGHYVDPRTLPLDEVAAAIPCPQSPNAKVATLSYARQKRAAST